jgi:hypothetical protein
LIYPFKIKYQVVGTTIGRPQGYMQLLINMNVILTNHFVGADIIRPKTSSQPNELADNIRPYKVCCIF